MARLKWILKPITFEEKEFVQKKDGTLDGITHLIIKPEAFRIWFYILFFVYSFLAYIITTNSVSIDYSNNIILDTFGSNNICLYYDYPPFNYFGTSLWFFVYLPLFIYLIFDLFRIYDSYIDKQIKKRFVTMYCFVTLFEILSGIFFFQITATSPFENITIHSIPYVFFSISFFTLALKRFFYFKEIGLFKTYKIESKLFKFGQFIYVFSLGFSAVFRLLTAVPNAFGAKLWTIDGLEWTNGVSSFNAALLIFMATIYPFFMYLFLIPYLETVKIVLNRKIPNIHNN